MADRKERQKKMKNSCEKYWQNKLSKNKTKNMTFLSLGIFESIFKQYLGWSANILKSKQKS